MVGEVFYLLTIWSKPHLFMTMILIQRIPLWNIFDLDFLRFSLQLKNVKESHEFLIKLAVGDVKNTFLERLTKIPLDTSDRADPFS